MEILTEIKHLLLDPAHWGQEIVAEVILFTLELVLLDRLFHRHTR